MTPTTSDHDQMINVVGSNIEPRYMAPKLGVKKGSVPIGAMDQNHNSFSFSGSFASSRQPNIRH